MNTETITAILNTKPSRTAMEAAHKLFGDYKLSGVECMAAVVQHVSDVAKEADLFAESRAKTLRAALSKHGGKIVWEGE